MPLTGLNRNIQETLTPWQCWSPDAAGEALRKKLTPEQIPTQMHQTKAMDLRLFTAFRELWEASSRIFNSNGFTDKGLPKKNTRNPKGRGFQGSFASLGYQQEPRVLSALFSSAPPLRYRDMEDGSHFLLSRRKRVTLPSVCPQNFPRSNNKVSFV